jgi:hypothetical protein
MIVYLGGATYANNSAPPASKAPEVAVNLAQFGWVAPSLESNRVFFKDFTLGKLFARDDNTRVFFLNEDVIVCYHTKQEGKDWRTAPRFIEAFFIGAKDGSLVTTHRWPTGLRRALDGLIDSQARLIPLDGGRFLVVTNGVITLYDLDLELLKQQKLEPSTASDLWAAQSVDSGRGIFLRHESTSEPVRYLWLNSGTLEVKYQMPGYRGRKYSIGGAIADESSVFERTRAGLRMIDRDQRVRIVCDDPLCRESGSLRALSRHYLGWSGRSGIGIVDKDRGLIWSRLVEPQYQRNGFQFGQMQSAMSGTRFALWIGANKKAYFDGAEIRDVTILVYDLANLKDRPSVLQMKPTTADWCFALSPNGTTLAVFDGTRLQVLPL